MPEAIIEAEPKQDTVFDKLERVITSIKKAETEGAKSTGSVAALSLLQSAAQTEDVSKVTNYLDRYKDLYFLL